MKLEDVLDNFNIDKKVYVSDVHRWLKGKVSIKDCREIAKKLTEVRGIWQKSQI